MPYIAQFDEKKCVLKNCILNSLFHSIHGYKSDCQSRRGHDLKTKSARRLRTMKGEAVCTHCQS